MNFIYTGTQGKNWTFFPRRVKYFQGGRILIFYPEIVKYRNLLCVKLLFSCKLSKTDPQSHFGTFPKGVDHCSRGVEPPTPIKFYPSGPHYNIDHVIMRLQWIAALNLTNVQKHCFCLFLTLALVLQPLAEIRFQHLIQIQLFSRSKFEC